MRTRNNQETGSIYEVFSDMALLMLAAFIFILAMILMVSKMQGNGDSELDKAAIASLEDSLAKSNARNVELMQEMNSLVGADSEQQMNKVLASAGFGVGQGRKDFELMVQGLRALPGKDLHLVIDATGSMHGATSFLIPVLRVIAIRSGKKLAAVSWYADNKTNTATGSMGAMFDQLMQEAPFSGSDESIGHAFDAIAQNSPIPGAYL
ncbi:MAG: hypothetical protein Q9M17_07570, partial [Mariprofundus sp.]|nr:hypothetical protein [Mariprofundus sp.]